MMGRIKIKRAIERVPGGMMLVPLLLGACVATFAPHAGAFFGSFTNALFTGSLNVLSVFYVRTGRLWPVVFAHILADVVPMTQGGAGG